jgi:Flp pilus assembly protein TadD
MAAARQTLLSGEVISVLDVALRHGFNHPGRFAIAYTRAFGQPPSATLRAARAQAPIGAYPAGTPIMLRALVPAVPGDAARARRATDDLAIALGRVRDLVLLSPDAALRPGTQRTLRLEGRVEADCVVLSLTQAGSGVVLRTLRQPLPRAGCGWADHAVGALRAAILEQQIKVARRVPRQRADVETLVQRARPAALSQEPALLGIALDMLDEALLRDPTHARAQALAGWCRALGANHALTHDPDGERDRAIVHCRRALALSPDDPEVLTPVAGALSLARHLDEAECLVARSLAVDPDQPEAVRRLGFIHNFRGNGRQAATAFRRALSIYPGGSDGAMALIGLGIAKFILGDYPRSARMLTRALDLQPTRAWPHRFLTAAAMHAGAHDDARRSLVLLRRSFPDLTVDQCAQSDVLHAEAKERMLDGLARAGLPH